MLWFSDPYCYLALRHSPRAAITIKRSARFVRRSLERLRKVIHSSKGRPKAGALRAPAVGTVFATFTPIVLNFTWMLLTFDFNGIVRFYGNEPLSDRFVRQSVILFCSLQNVRSGRHHNTQLAISLVFKRHSLWQSKHQISHCLVVFKVCVWKPIL